MVGQSTRSTSFTFTIQALLRGAEFRPAVSCLAGIFVLLFFFISLRLLLLFEGSDAQYISLRVMQPFNTINTIAALTTVTTIKYAHGMQEMTAP
jgi:hypothetical protein